MDPFEHALDSELERRLAAGAGLPDAERLGVSVDQLRHGTSANETSSLGACLLHQFKRPTIPFDGDALGAAASRVWNRRLAVAARHLERAGRAVGRIALEGYPGLEWAGTCSLISARAAVTTRSVAALFSSVAPGRNPIRQYTGAPPVSARAIFGGSISTIIETLVAGDEQDDIVFLMLDPEPAGIDPIPMDGGGAQPAWLAAIGFAAADSRTGRPVLDLVYQLAANRKCLSPGRLVSEPDAMLLRHDCAIPGMGAGAVLVDLASDRGVGLHLAGAADGPGIAAPAKAIVRAMQAVGIAIPARAQAAPADGDFLERARRTAAFYQSRRGYDPGFIGRDVPPPRAGSALSAHVLRTDTLTGDPPLLHYANFSVCMHTERRMCIFTACNVSGGELQDLSRAGIRWQFDARFDEALQAGDDLYVDNDLDRGHMVRRLDPVWGDDAETANEDTFHFTNSCPQHKNLNQKTWNDLEDYVLDNAGKYRMKIDVFTGPVFSDQDPEYRGFRIPLEFWKVVVMLKDDGNLSATAYKLSQVDLVTGLEFAFGEFRTYQVPLKDVEEWTGLDFGELRNFDPKGLLEGAERYVPIAGPADIQL
ncbi:MAG TPA: DNA/RNA non-specific endonuclease [Vicinamibacterales bacterium]|nr:DNA/RNA non-specific endonuclease [Vicinamibacterales bacterium]